MASKTKEVENHQETWQNFSSLITTSFPSQTGLSDDLTLYRHPIYGFHVNQAAMTSFMLLQLHFKPIDSDILLGTFPKSGTTWIKALLFMIKTRKVYPTNSNNHPLNTLNPHECVPFLELQVYTENHILDIDSIPSPRLFATHLPFGALPETVINLGCKIVYLCRSAKDTFISLWHFMNYKHKEESGTELLSLDAALDCFCNGVLPFGPYWDHVLGYWNAHLERPDQVLFLMYEQMKQDPISNVMKIAEFVGFGFSEDEVKDGVCEQIVEFCGFEKLKGLDANKNGMLKVFNRSRDKKSFFRRGVVGDWKNYLTTDMARKIDEVTLKRFEGSGLKI